MKKLLTLPLVMMLTISLSAQTKVEWVSTSQQEQWKVQKGLTPSSGNDSADVQVQLNQPRQFVKMVNTEFCIRSLFSLYDCRILVPYAIAIVTTVIWIFG
ncbi:MAG: hypothetical protein ACHQF0_10535 [Chitinophagales bacterium]